MIKKVGELRMNEPFRLDKSRALELFRVMHAARCCDEEELLRVRSGSSHFTLGGSGSEITAAAALFLDDGDYCSLHYRCRALRIARGIPLSDIASNFFASSRAEGEGRQLTAMESSHPQRVVPVVPPIAAHCLPACGVAWSTKLWGERAITVCTVGDGGTRQGEFLESVAFAMERALPVLFVIINNGLAISTSTAGATAVDLGMVPARIVRRIHGCEINDLLYVFRAAVNDVRSGDGPFLIDLEVPRLASHSSNDHHEHYRSSENLEQARRQDPLSAFANYLVSLGFDRRELAKTREDVRREVLEAYETASREMLRTHRLPEDIYSIDQSRESAVISDRSHPIQLCYRMRDAITDAIGRALDGDPEAILFGQDVEDPYGGVFRLTTSLSTRHPLRVLNSPLAEATILGAGFGLAITGRRTFLEIQFVDFLEPGWNQLVSNIATLFWRTNGAWKCPLVLYAPCGGRCPGAGTWHSQVNASRLLLNEGLTVVIPSNPIDAQFAFRQASDCTTPTFILLPKSRMWRRYTSEEIASLMADQTAASGTRQLDGGDELTIVSWGDGVALAQDALCGLAHVRASLFDVWRLSRPNLTRVVESFNRTRRLLVLDEEGPIPVVAHEIVSQIRARAGETADGEFRILCKSHQHVGSNFTHEQSITPQVDDVAVAIDSLLSL